MTSSNRLPTDDDRTPGGEATQHVAAAADGRDLAAELEAAREELRSRREEQLRLERELADTNLGVVALYADLDDKAERLRRTDEAKSAFLSGVSHELRTPLNSILALARLLLDRADGPLTDEQERQVGYIRQSAEDLLVLVNNLLDLSRIEAGRTEVSVTPFTLGELLRRLEGELHPLLRNPAVRLVFEPPPEAQLATDEAKLSQVVRNFVSNAIKYTERGTVTVSAQCTGERVRIAVADTGIGIAGVDQARIFEEFVQIPGELQTRAKGTGLGLALSRALAMVLGGSVGVESEPGTGSTFWVEVPIRHASATAVEQAAAPAEAATVLVVDDDQIARYVVCQMLRAEGHRPIEATGGIDGLSRARALSPSAIVLDLSMPDLDGIEVLRRLKEDATTADSPVIVYSARDLSPGERSRLAGQAAAVVTKTDGASRDLRDAVRTVLGSTPPPEPRRTRR